MYSFEPSEEQQMLIDAIQRFSTNDLRPKAREVDEKREIPASLITKGWELGLLQTGLPEEYGGFGDYSSINGVLAAEELAWGDLAGAMAILTPGLFALPLLLVGNTDQKNLYLPEIINGWRPYTAALLEPSFDFDTHDLKTSASDDTDSYLLNGEKIYVPFANQADRLIVYASYQGGTQGFIVSKDTPGLQVQEQLSLLGVRALPLFRVTLTGVRVLKENRLGGPDGHDFAPIFNLFQITNAALALGVARAAYEYARDYAKEREAFGVKIAQKQAIAFMLAEMVTEIEAIRLLTWEAAWMFDNHKPDASKQAYLAVTGATDMVMMVTDRAVQILGGHGYIREHPVEMWMRNGRGFATFTGLAMV